MNHADPPIDALVALMHAHHLDPAACSRTAAENAKQAAGLFNCTVCTKMFINANRLKAHMKSAGHTANKAMVKRELSDADEALRVAEATGSDQETSVARSNYTLAFSRHWTLRKLYPTRR